MLSPAMQGVILAIAKARQTFDRDGSEAGLVKVLTCSSGACMPEAQPADIVTIWGFLPAFAGSKTQEAPEILERLRGGRGGASLDLGKRGLKLVESSAKRSYLLSRDYVHNPA